MKKCSRCKNRKPLSQFHANKKRKDGHHNHCKECRGEYAMIPSVRAAQLANKKKHYTPETNRDRHLKYGFGITVAQYESMLVRQGGGCAICGHQLIDQHGRRLAVDHCHKTNKVRGLLCASCNNGLGRFKDDPSLLARAIAYLTKAA